MLQNAKRYLANEPVMCGGYGNNFSLPQGEGAIDTGSRWLAPLARLNIWNLEVYLTSMRGGVPLPKLQGCNVALTNKVHTHNYTITQLSMSAIYFVSFATLRQAELIKE